MVSVNDLVNELKTLVSGVPEVATKGFSVYSMEELEALTGHVPSPLVGIAYNGAQKVENSAAGQRGLKTTAFVTAYFSVVVAISYQHMTDADTKVDALDLLDQLRATIMGYTGANSRPWIFNGEQPMGPDTEGVIYYGQTWETSLPMLSNN